MGQIALDQFAKQLRVPHYVTRRWVRGGYVSAERGKGARILLAAGDLLNLLAGRWHSPVREDVDACQAAAPNTSVNSTGRARARKFKTVMADIPYAFFIALWDRQQGRCEYCREPMPREHSVFGTRAARPTALHPSVDHTVPFSRGGAHVKSNIKWVCMRCNSRKRRMTGVEYRALLRGEANA